jgi:hypothetical protein
MGDEIDEIKNLTVRCGRLIIDYPLTSANLVQPEMNSIPHVLKRPTTSGLRLPKGAKYLTKHRDKN